MQERRRRNLLPLKNSEIADLIERQRRKELNGICKKFKELRDHRNH